MGKNSTVKSDDLRVEVAIIAGNALSLGQF